MFLQLKMHRRTLKTIHLNELLKMGESTEIAKGFKKLNLRPLNEWSGPYRSLELAYNSIPLVVRRGLKFGIEINGNITEYWCRDSELTNGKEILYV